MNTHLVFVYGTLRRGSAQAMSIRFPGARFVADAKVSGSLFDLGAYPGLLVDDSNSLVIGEVYEVNDESLGSWMISKPQAIIGGSRSRYPLAPIPRNAGSMHRILKLFRVTN